MEIYKIKNLTFSYPQVSKKVLDDISLTINEGEFVVLCGKSGSGKSTLLKHLKPTLTPYGERSGEILFEESDILGLDFKSQSQKIGYVFQNPENQIVTDKVWHELAFGLESLGTDKDMIRLKVAEIASFFGISNWFMKNTTDLSGGQKQILSLAGVMAMQPRVLILDEPTGQLDPIAATEFIKTLEKINQELGTTIILTEHRLEEVLPIADKVFVIDNGTIISYGTPHDVGEELKYKGNDMFLSMPCAMQIYSKVSTNEECPITVKEGRNFLKKVLHDKEPYEKKKIAPPANTENVISVKNVWFKYEKNGKDILEDFNLDVQMGSIHAILGGNGVGKSTALSILTGINKPYKGKIYINGLEIGKYTSNQLYKNNLGVLPQNPQTLFIHKTVYLDLKDVIDAEKMSENEKSARVKNIANLLELTPLFDLHPYDLSGGEQQRLALAKVMLLEPKILVLDEPTKGLDNCLKEKLAHILSNIIKNGGTVLMVSHDIEFCGKYADVCSLFFNGSIVTTQETRNFFSGNSFYTTAANRIARDIFPKAITSEEVIELCQLTLKNKKLKI